MSVVSPPSLPPAVAANSANPRPRLASETLPTLRQPTLQHAHSVDYTFDPSRTPSPASSSYSSLHRPGILRSVSVGDGLNATSPGGSVNVSFAPLPEIAPRKRKSTRSLGLAARSQMLKAQAERRAAQQEQDLAWEDLTQLMKDASKLFKRVVGKSSKTKLATQRADDPVPPPDDNGMTVQDLLLQQHAAQSREKPLSDVDDRPRSPPPLAPYRGDDDDPEDSGDGIESRESEVNDDHSSSSQTSPDSDDNLATPISAGTPGTNAHDEQVMQLP